MKKMSNISSFSSSASFESRVVCVENMRGKVKQLVHMGFKVGNVSDLSTMHNFELE